MAAKNWEMYFLAVIKGQKKGLLASSLRTILWLMSCPYRMAVASRNWLYDHGWFKSYTPPVPLVISIGNITAGGTGKTPVTLMLAKEFHDKASLAILSRGYRSQAEKFSTPVLLHRKRGVHHPASLCGDESYMLAENLPNALVIVGRNRYQSSKLAAKLGAEILLLDDGMQHRGIARDLEVVVMDVLDPFGQGYFLPRGLLREGKNALGRADLIILNHVDDQEKLEKIKRQISHITSAPVIGVKLEVLGLYDLKGQLVELSNEKVGIFCGIAHPEYFLNTVNNIGHSVIKTLFMPDHDAFDTNQLIHFSSQCKSEGASFILCTEKDRVKLVDEKGFHLPIYWVKMGLKVVEGSHHWSTFIHHVKTTLNLKN